MKFSKGDILIPCDAQFPEGAVVVDGYDKGGRLLAHPMGGGPQLVFTEVRLSGFRAVAESEQRGQTDEIEPKRQAQRGQPCHLPREHFTRVEAGNQHGIRDKRSEGEKGQEQAEAMDGNTAVER